jgi:hypothetical protein
MRETDVLPIMLTEARLLNYLRMTLKFAKVQLKVFFQIILSIERQITSQLLSKGSFCKFIF